MACINPDGTLTPTAQTVLAALRAPASAADVAQLTNLPIYRVRSSLRELVEAGLVAQEGDRYQLTDKGNAKL
jgi:DNA-binding IclR family transcriptional regulator